MRKQTAGAVAARRNIKTFLVFFRSPQFYMPFSSSFFSFFLYEPREHKHERGGTMALGSGLRIRIKFFGFDGRMRPASLNPTTQHGSGPFKPMLPSSLMEIVLAYHILL
jgi:hypothetical protein